jgi:hypothetical protein
MFGTLLGIEVPGGFGIDLGAGQGTAFPNYPAGGPCTYQHVLNFYTSDCYLVSSLITPTPSTFLSCTAFWGPNCSPLATLAPVTRGTGGETQYTPAFQLSGVVPGSQTEIGQIGYVYTQIYLCGSLNPVSTFGTGVSTISPSACAAATSTVLVPGTVPNLSILGLTTGDLTANPVSVTAGQSIAVTVQISFGSGS